MPELDNYNNGARNTRRSDHATATVARLSKGCGMADQSIRVGDTVPRACISEPFNPYVRIRPDISPENAAQAGLPVSVGRWDLMMRSSTMRWVMMGIMVVAMLVMLTSELFMIGTNSSIAMVVGLISSGIAVIAGSWMTACND